MFPGAGQRVTGTGAAMGWAASTGITYNAFDDLIFLAEPGEEGRRVIWKLVLRPPAVAVNFPLAQGGNGIEYWRIMRLNDGRLEFRAQYGATVYRWITTLAMDDLVQNDKRLIITIAHRPYYTTLDDTEIYVDNSFGQFSGKRAITLSSGAAPFGLPDASAFTTHAVLPCGSANQRDISLYQIETGILPLREARRFFEVMKNNDAAVEV
jgi:hypothetical protein